jgi:hypothetical protein
MVAQTSFPPDSPAAKSITSFEVLRTNIETVRLDRDEVLRERIDALAQRSAEFFRTYDGSQKAGHPSADFLSLIFAQAIQSLRVFATFIVSPSHLQTSVVMRRLFGDFLTTSTVLSFSLKGLTSALTGLLGQTLPSQYLRSAMEMGCFIKSGSRGFRLSTHFVWSQAVYRGIGLAIRMIARRASLRLVAQADDIQCRC